MISTTHDFTKEENTTVVNKTRAPILLTTVHIGLTVQPFFNIIVHSTEQQQQHVVLEQKG